MEQFNCKIVSAEGILFEGMVKQIKASNSEGFFSILAHHCDFFSVLKPNQIELTFISDQKKVFPIKQGVLSFKDNQCEIMVE